jgi:hypothetical protein
MTTLNGQGTEVDRARELLTELSSVSTELDALRRRAENILADVTTDYEASYHSPEVVEHKVDHDAGNVNVDDANGSGQREMVGFDLLNAKALIKAGELISKEALCERLRIGPARLFRYVYYNNMFSIDVDGVAYFPACFAQPLESNFRLRCICKTISRAPVEARLSFLTMPRNDLDGRSPIDCLSDTDAYPRVTEAAKAWLERQFRTSIRAYEGVHSVEPDVGSVALMAVGGCHPAEDVWARALKVVDSDECEGGTSSDATVQAATLFVSQASAYTGRELQAKVDIEVVGNTAHVRTERVVHIRGKTTIALPGEQTIRNIVRSVVDALDQPGPDRVSKL